MIRPLLTPIMSGIVRGLTGEKTQAATGWILALGAWDDAGLWIDSEAWNDN